MIYCYSVILHVHAMCNIVLQGKISPSRSNAESKVYI